MRTLPFQLRKFQKTCLSVFQEKIETPEQSTTVDASPGAGKTKLGVACAAHAIDAGHVEKVIVVAPTREIQRQWTKEAIEADVQVVDLDFSGARIQDAQNTDHDGLVITYQFLTSGASTSLYIREFCARFRTLVIFDEIHHLGEKRKWGEIAAESFAPSYHRLCLSGTPFRTDGRQIPFINYEHIDGEYRAKPDAGCVYSYGDAVRDRVCLPLAFHHMDAVGIEGEVTITNGLTGEQWVDAINIPSLRDSDGKLESKALRMALGFEELTEFAMESIDRGVDILKMQRETKRDAGGLLICMGIKHAKAVCDYLSNAHGVGAVLVTSEEKDAHRDIDRFRKSDDEWIVSVGMISEGVDIPRLETLVYLAHIQAAIFVKQAFLRVARAQQGYEDRKAAVVFPASPELRAIANQIEKQVIKGIIERGNQEDREGPSAGVRVTYEGHAAQAADSGMTVRGEFFEQSIVDVAKELAIMSGKPTEQWLANVRDRGIRIEQPQKRLGKNRSVSEELQSWRKSVHARSKQFYKAVAGDHPNRFKPGGYFLKSQGIKIAFEDIKDVEQAKDMVRRIEEQIAKAELGLIVFDQDAKEFRPTGGQHEQARA